MRETLVGIVAIELVVHVLHGLFWVFSPGAAHAQQPDLRGTWRVERIAGEPVIEGSTVTLQFDDQGRISGRASCNRFTGSYTLAADRLTIGPAATTRMACAEAQMGQEMRFLRMLDGVKRWSIAESGTLIVTGEDGTVALRARREP